MLRRIHFGLSVFSFIVQATTLALLITIVVMVSDFNAEQIVGPAIFNALQQIAKLNFTEMGETLEHIGSLNFTAVNVAIEKINRLTRFIPI